MKFFNKPIRTKLRLVIISAVILTITLIFAGLYIYEHISYTNISSNELKSKADLIAYNISETVALTDTLGTVKILSSLKSQNHIISSAVYNNDGKIIATYTKNNEPIVFPDIPGPAGVKRVDDGLVIFKLLQHSNTRVGYIYMKMDLSEENERRFSYIIITLLVLTGALFFAFIITNIFERKFSEPVLNLTNAMKRVSEKKDFTIRAEKTTDDEIGYLADTFNNMLEEMGARNQNLRETNKLLAEEIREKNKTEKILKKNEEKFRSLFRNHPMPIFIYDLETLNFLEVNEAAIDKYGYTRSEFLGMKITDIRPPEEIPKLMENLNQVRQVKEHSGPWRHLLKNGNTIDVEVFSCITTFIKDTAVLVVIVDITEKLKAEGRLKASEERYRTTLDSMMEGCQIIDFNFRYIYLNDSASRQGHFPKEQLLGKTMMEMYPGIEKSELFSFLKKCMAERTASRITNEFVYPDGSVGWFNLDIEPVPEGVFILSTDITNEKNLNDELSRYREHLEELVEERTKQLDIANKELEAFSYSVSHDLRAPLRHIDGFGQLLARHIKNNLDEKGLHYLNMIADSVKQMGILIDELLVFSRMGRVEMSTQTTDMNRIIEEVILGFTHDIEGRNIEWKIQELPVVNADPSMIKLVFQNLIGNALKYTRPRENTVIEIGKTSSDAGMVIFVKDNGVGFDMRYIDKLFGVFQRLHHSDEFEGTGIGLANVRRIISRHGGNTWAYGEIDKGAVFYFSLPVK